MRFQDLFKLAMDRELPEIYPDSFGNILNLGAGNKIIPGTKPLDYPEWDADKDPIPFPDRSVDQIHAYHFFEHCADPVKVLLECQRVLKYGCHINICVPYYNSQMQAQDLDHKSAFCEETWRNILDNPYYDKRKVDWKLEVRFNLICGVVERNMCLLTQMVKVCGR